MRGPVTEHPSLQPYVDAWTHSIESIVALVTPLAESEWNRRTECPGWSVRDQLSHIIGTETEILGDPRPIHTLPRDLYHVTDEPSRYMEVQVDVRRHHTAPEMTSELEYTLIRRNRQLRNDKRAPDVMVRSLLPGGGEISLETMLRMRAADIWMHEQDMRRALRRPGNLDSPAAYIARDVLVQGLPKVVAKRASAPAESAVVFDVHGPLEFMRTVRVNAEGKGSVNNSPSLGPAVTFSLDWETYLRLACGRVRPEAVRDQVKVEGDNALADAILANFSVTP